MFTGIREISLAVRDVELARDHFETWLGIPPSEIHSYPVPPVQSRATTFRLGASSIALMESTVPGGPIDRFIQRRGEGVFSITLAVKDIDRATRHLQENGLEFVLDRSILFEDYHAYDGVYKLVKMNFVRPKSAHGLLIEIQELQ